MSEPHSKIVKDCIYGFINIPELCLHFIDTPEFQRLRRVKQLGMVHYAYPSAVHTRFEHSLGVMHLCGKMVDQLRNFTDISERKKELIQLAGLYHDIGHFSYSHLFDSFLSKFENDKDLPDIFKLKDHEDRSLFFLAKVNSVLRILTPEEELFVSNVIIGNVPIGEPNYLYQIVCNKECGIDVDKMDYLKRDSFHTGFPGFQSDYIILNAKIDSELHLAFKKKAYNDIDDLFKARHRMFENVYQHHTSQKIDKIYFCMMKRLGSKLFSFGEKTDDCNIETLLRTSSKTSELIDLIDNRNLEHDCEFCREYSVRKTIKSSGTIEKVRFI